ncbi:glutathione-dependent formaldehyde-activating enzyme [Purpureocillium lavendulum]|uniref:Glutathione-dependent formaldehyde-activating enzyme n=1 Tax=Purpureocillium lavendulum TaxID=1247861 RepID=A0AB34FM91_9HYPO|nr:glutathione-dependent formaldehyde-activating enzyme [Purpureocillium lavendulum]
MVSPLSSDPGSSPRQGLPEYAEGLEAYIPGTQDYYDEDWFAAGRDSSFASATLHGPHECPAAPEACISPPTRHPSDQTRSATEYESGLESLTPSSDLKQVYDPASGKEAYNPGCGRDAYAPRDDTTQCEARTCGLRRPIFWAVLVIVMVAVVAAAVGGGVGGSLANRHSAGSDTASDDSSSNGGNLSRTSLLPGTSLAAVNFTDQYGHDNLLVFYQLRSLALAQSAFNSSTGKWSASIVNSKTNEIKNGTALSASIYWRSKESRDTRVYYTGPDDKIYGQVVGGQGLAATQASWSPLAGVSGNFAIAPNSRLVSSGRENADAYEGDFLMYQDTSGVIRVQRRQNSNEGDGSKSGQWSSSNVPFSLGRAANSSGMALTPIYNAGPRALNLFFGNETDGRAEQTLTHASLMHNTVWRGASLPAGLDKGTAIAAFSWGYNSTETGAKKPRKEGGNRRRVEARAGADGVYGGEVVVQGDVAGIKKNGSAPRTIAVSQAGRVYGVVDSSDGDGAEIVEWRWKSGSEYEEMTCHCGKVKHNLARAAGPRDIELCHCYGCRHSTGELYASYYKLDKGKTLPLLSSPALSKYTSVESQSGGVQDATATLYFCSTCGCHVFRTIADANESSIEVATGTLVDGGEPTAAKFASHVRAGETRDGGLTKWLGEPLLIKDHETGLKHHAADDEQQQPASQGDTLAGSCLCRGVALRITRPNADSRKPHSGFADLIIPFHTGDPDIKNPDDVKWWLREDGTKYMAGLCACQTCRLVSGFELQSWAFVPRTNIEYLQTTSSGVGGGEVTDGTWSALDFDTVREKSTLRGYESSPGVMREFCGRCGATVFWHDRWRPDLIDVSVGLLQDGQDGARAEGWLSWFLGRVSFAEDVVLGRQGWPRETARGLVEHVERSMKTEEGGKNNGA